MRIVLAALFALIAGSAVNAAQADPYRWCSIYMGEDGGSSNCYFVTLEQCRANVSGVGGFCQPSPFYTRRGDDQRRGPAQEAPPALTPRPARGDGGNETAIEGGRDAYRDCQPRRPHRWPCGRRAYADQYTLVRAVQRPRRREQQLLFRDAGAVPGRGVGRRRILPAQQFLHRPRGAAAAEQAARVRLNAAPGAIRGWIVRRPIWQWVCEFGRWPWTRGWRGYLSGRAQARGTSTTRYRSPRSKTRERGTHWVLSPAVNSRHCRSICWRASRSLRRQTAT